MATDLYKTIKITPKREKAPPVKQKAYRGFSTVNPESTTFQQFDIGLIKQNLLNHFNIRQGENYLILNLVVLFGTHCMSR